MLALIAGRGQLPVHLAGRLRAAGTAFRVFALQGAEPEPGVGPEVETFRLERLGSLLARLAAEGVGEVCFAGAISRPGLDPALLDAATRPLLPRIAAALALGDDGALRVALELFEERGLTIRAAQEIAPDLLLPEGVATRVCPGPGVAADIAVARRVLAELGAGDAGQACVVAGGREVAREGPGGTDAMLSALGDSAAGGILFKAPKPGQDRRIDLPTIGPRTVEGAAAAGLGGIVIEAGGVLVLERARVIAESEAAGLFLWSRGAG